MTYPDLPLTRGSVRAEALWHIHELSARTVQPGEISSGTLRDRVQKAIDWFWIYLDTTEGRTLTALGTSLPALRSDIADEYPRTAAAFAARELDLIQGFDYLMDGLELDPDQLDQQ